MKRILPITVAAVLFVNSSFAGPIHDAAKEGDLAGVQEAIDDGANVKAKTIRGWAPLNYSGGQPMRFYQLRLTE